MSEWSEPFTYPPKDGVYKIKTVISEYYALFEKGAWHLGGPSADWARGAPVYEDGMTNGQVWKRIEGVSPKFEPELFD